MEILTGADHVIAFFQALMVIGALALATGLAVAARDLVTVERPRRLARRESVPAYYLGGHAFSH